MARHAVVITLSDLVHALEADPTPEQEKIDKARGAVRSLVAALNAAQNARLDASLRVTGLKRSQPTKVDLSGLVMVHWEARFFLLGFARCS